MNKACIQMLVRAGLAAAVVAMLAALAACASPPVQAMSDARQAVAAAAKAGAADYAPRVYAQARHWLSDAEFSLKHWDYGRARESAQRAERAARAAILAARKARAPAVRTAPSALSTPELPLPAQSPAFIPAG